MANRREVTGAWKSEQVVAAVVSGVAVVLVAIIGLVGLLGDDTATPVEPEILIRETAFVARSSGEVEIRVAGTVKDFPPKPGSTAVVRSQGESERRNALLVQENRSCLGKDSTCAEGHLVDASVPRIHGRFR